MRVLRRYVPPFCFHFWTPPEARKEPDKFLAGSGIGALETLVAARNRGHRTVRSALQELQEAGEMAKAVVDEGGAE